MLLDMKAINSSISTKLGIYQCSQEYSDNLPLITEYYDDILSWLLKLNVFRYFKSYVNNKLDKSSILILLPGLRLNQCIVAESALRDNKQFNSYEKSQRQELTDKVLETAYGNILEQIVQAHLLNMYGYENVFKYRANVLSNRSAKSDCEYDCVVLPNRSSQIGSLALSRAACLIEVKWSINALNAQAKHLVNDRLFAELAQVEDVASVRHRIVVYRGKNCTLSVEGYTIQYVNIEDFLLNTRKYIE